MFNMLEKSVRNILKHITMLAYYMRGGISYDDLLWKTPVERDIIEEVIEERLKAQAKVPFPIF